MISTRSPGALDRLLLPAAADRPRDLLRVALLAVLPEDRRQLPLGSLVHEVGGRQLGRRIHAHVERRVDRVGEAALGTVDLHARDAEVEQDRVGVHAVLGELVEDDRCLAAEEARLHSGVAAEALEVRPDGRVAVDRDEATLAAQIGGEHSRMAAGAEGGVDDVSPGSIARSSRTSSARTGT